MKLAGRYLEILIGACLSVVVITTFLQVFFRFVLKIPAPWTEEVTRIAFVDMVFLGAALAVKHNSHLSVDVINHFPRTFRMIIVSLGYVICIAFVVLLVYYGWIHSINNKDQYTPTLSISNLYLYIIIPISGIIMVYYLIRAFIDEVFRGQKEAK